MIWSTQCLEPALLPGACVRGSRGQDEGFGRLRCTSSLASAELLQSGSAWPRSTPALPARHAPCAPHCRRVAPSAPKRHALRPRATPCAPLTARHAPRPGSPAVRPVALTAAKAAAGGGAGKAAGGGGGGGGGGRGRTGLKPIQGVGRLGGGRKGRQRFAGVGFAARRPRTPAGSSKFPHSPWAAARGPPSPRGDPRPPRPRRGSPGAARRRPGAAPRQVRSWRGARRQVTLWSARPGPAAVAGGPRAVIVCAGRLGRDSGHRGGAAGGRASPPGWGLRRPGPRPARAGAGLFAPRFPFPTAGSRAVPS